MNLFNLHTHFLNTKTNINTIYSFNISETKKISKKIEKYSIGIHPWFINEDILSADFEKLTKFAKNDRCFAIGECGLDRLHKGFLNLQKDVFLKQIKLSIQINKPLIIHCVKAYYELLQIRKQYLNTPLWIVHGFNASKEIAQDLLKYNILLSFGANLRHSQKLQNIIKSLPDNSFFLETDESDINIRELYAFVKQMNCHPIRKFPSLS